MARAHRLVSALLLLLLFISPCFAAKNILYSGQRLWAGEYLSYGDYRLVIQADCNLVLYDKDITYWDTNTAGHGLNCYLTMQSDGNLVVYTPEGTAIWDSGTDKGNGHYVLVLQKDRNLVIYGGALWATGTDNGLAGITITLPSV